MDLHRVANRVWSVGRRAHAVSLPKVRREVVPLVHEGGWALNAALFRPAGVEGPLPAVLLVPGLGAPGSVFEGWSEPANVRELAALGVVVLTIDLSGRGKSWGIDTFGGPEHHGDVRVALRYLAGRPDVRGAAIGVVSFSLGCTAVAGALASGAADLPRVAWWIDWEGPCDREIITSGGRMMDPAMGHSLADDAYWAPREAVVHVGRVGVPYLRYQSERDHAQPGEFRHAERMIRAAAAGSSPWFQLNDHGRGCVPDAPRWMPAGNRAAREWIREQVRLLHALP